MKELFLSSMREALTSIPSTTEKGKKKRKNSFGLENRSKVRTKRLKENIEVSMRNCDREDEHKGISGGG